MNNLTTVARELADLQKMQAQVIRDHESQLKHLRSEISKRQRILTNTELGLDNDKISLAETVLEVFGNYRPDYGDSASCVRDAIQQLATGVPIRRVYGDLWRVFFGVKDYAHWSGQRDDCTYGCGPRHGSTVFSVGLSKAKRTAFCTDGTGLTPEEIEAAIYYLINLQRIQEARQKAAA